MKKYFICVIMLLATGFLFAGNVEVRIQIVGATYPQLSNDAVFLMQNDWYTAAKDTSDIVKMMNGATQVNVYAITPLGNLSTMQSDNLIGTFIGFRSNANTSYTMSFDWLKGGMVKIQDTEQDSIFLATADAQYAFTATASTTYNSRFKIYDIIYPTEPTICHQYGQLQVFDYIGNVVIKQMDDTIVGTYPVEGDRVIDLSALAAGQYRVVFNGTTMVIVVKSTAVD